MEYQSEDAERSGGNKVVAWVCKRPDYKARSQAAVKVLGWFVCKHAMNAEPRRQVSLGRVPRVTRRNIPEDAILHSHHRENLKSYLYILVCIQSPRVRRNFMERSLPDFIHITYRGYASSAEPSTLLSPGKFWNCDISFRYQERRKIRCRDVRSTRTDIAILHMSCYYWRSWQYEQTRVIGGYCRREEYDWKERMPFWLTSRFSVGYTECHYIEHRRCNKFETVLEWMDRLCGLVVRVTGC
jgi:hypothetical protein